MPASLGCEVNQWSPTYSICGIRSITPPPHPTPASLRLSCWAWELVQKTHRFTGGTRGGGGGRCLYTIQRAFRDPRSRQARPFLDQTQPDVCYCRGAPTSRSWPCPLVHRVVGTPYELVQRILKTVETNRLRREHTRRLTPPPLQVHHTLHHRVWLGDVNAAARR